MFRWALRFFLLRVLPRRMILFMSLADLFFLLRSLRRLRFTAPQRINEPRQSRTAPPPPTPASGSVTRRRTR